MVFETRIFKIGGSFAVVLPMHLIEEKEVFEGEYIKIEDFEKVEGIFEFECKKCLYRFNSKKDDAYCPGCFEENALKEIDRIDDIQNTKLKGGKK